MTFDLLVVIRALGGSVSERHVVPSGHGRGVAASPLGATLDLIAEMDAGNGGSVPCTYANSDQRTASENGGRSSC
jgi:hypothetical protein